MVGWVAAWVALLCHGPIGLRSHRVTAPFGLSLLGFLFFCGLVVFLSARLPAIAVLASLSIFDSFLLASSIFDSFYQTTEETTENQS